MPPLYPSETFVINTKLARFFDIMALKSTLDEEDRHDAFRLPLTRKTFKPAGYIVRQGDISDSISIVLEGYCYGQRDDGQGKSQIVSLGIPGDAVGIEHLFLRTADHDTRALTEIEVAIIPLVAVQQLALRRPAIAQALGIRQAINNAIAREWLVNIGGRDGLRRVSHFLCEFAVRSDAWERVTSAGYELPMSQEQIGQATGLTAVHVNRMLKTLHTAGLIERSWRYVRFSNWEGLQDIADFSVDYLHFGRQVDTPARATQPT
ncbi:Crp/Fnr family transcriptional regulator [Sphingomonas sp. Leaf34]|uniref:Crp/Fnr family transcriptional regulator n=1 Tax=Sphingomonas sp. Leaf34 TaxID=1736216 RepID=UPI0009E6FA28|nr:Crp/Fnr family transcriptional regulator [Sphingomonas sp. Leaf34]